VVPIMLAARTRRAEFFCGATATATVIVSVPILRAVFLGEGAQDVASLKPANIESQAEKGF